MIVKITYPLVQSRAEVSTVMPTPSALLRAGSVKASPRLLKREVILTQLLRLIN